jgi:catechol 2,3-dioxygenase-like lactoylglutathione lyase family enzyme
MIRTWPIIGVRDVAASTAWYQQLLGLAVTPPAHDHFGMITDADGTVLVCLHAWGAHEHPTLTAPGTGDGNGLLLFFRVTDYEGALARVRATGAALEQGPLLNANTGTMEFSLRDPDGYYVSISALPAAS